MLQELVDQCIHSLSSWNNIVSLVDFEPSQLLVPIMLLLSLWLFCIFSFATSSHNAEAFRNLIQRKVVKPVLNSDSVHSLDFLRDLSPPFAMDDVHALRDLPDVTSPDVTHFCFLLHGHRGLSKDLTYMQTMMQRCAMEEKKRRLGSSPSNSSDEGLPVAPTNEDKDEGEEDEKTPQTEHLTHDMIVHNSVCNEYKTTDGIRNGGDRLVEEMRDVIEEEMKTRHPDAVEDAVYDITISILGNSLGGLFGRYAIAKLVERHCEKESEEEDAHWILDGKYRLHLNIFCTTATPHLGVSGHTYVRIPRRAEIGVAHALGDTGKDLFRLNDLLHTMSTCPTYLRPLAGFRKRIAYANAYGTDFAVPAGTAAFLSENSSYPHHFRDDLVVDESGLVLATLQTPQQAHDTESNNSQASREEANQVEKKSDDEKSSGSTKDAKSKNHADELDHMSLSLDKLGWKKVFIDIRSEMPSVGLPKSIMGRLQSSNGDNPDADEPVKADSSMHELMKQKVVQSKDVATALTSSTDNRLPIPLGHNMMVAFSRSRLSTFMNKGGRPVVDALAKELVEDIFTWNGVDNNATEIQNKGTNNDQ